MKNLWILKKVHRLFEITVNRQIGSQFFLISNTIR